MADRFWAERQRMIEQQIRRRGIRNAGVLRALAVVPRHLFVPPSARDAAYDDTPLAIGFSQTISQPYIVALMTDALELRSTDRVLEVGTGSGYQAAVLSHLAANVQSVELVPQLAARAGRVLARLGCTNVMIHVADGSLGWREAAPYDAIIVTAAAPRLPIPISVQLAERGRLVIPLVADHGYQLLTVFRRRGEQLSEQVLASVAFVPLRGRHGIKA